MRRACATVDTVSARPLPCATHDRSWNFDGKEGNHTCISSSLLSRPIRNDEEGQGLAEYALILALIAIVAIIALIFLGGQVSKILSTVGNSV